MEEKGKEDWRKEGKRGKAGNGNLTGRGGERGRGCQSEKARKGRCTCKLGVRSRREAQVRGEKGKEERQWQEKRSGNGRIRGVATVG